MTATDPLSREFEHHLQILLTHPDKVSFRNSSTWLEGFERSGEAWTICVEYLKERRASREVLFYSAQIVRKKSLVDLTQLAQQDAFGLRDMLMNFILGQYAQGYPEILRQLCIAFAGSSVQALARNIWPSAIEDICTMAEQRCEAIRPFLDVFEYLPEELEDRRIPLLDDQITQARLSFKSSSNRITFLISKILSGQLQVENQAVVLDSAFRVIASWAKASLLSFENMYALVGYCLSALDSESYFKAANDALVAFLYSCSQMPDFERRLFFFQTVADKILSMETSYNVAVENEDEDTCQSICILATDTAICLLDNMIVVPQLAYPRYFELINFLIKCFSHPLAEVGLLACDAWQRISDSLCERHFPALEVVQFLSSSFEKIFVIVLSRVCFAPDFESWTAEKQDAFRDHRHRMGQTLVDCAQVIGNLRAFEIIKDSLYVSIRASVAKNSWQGIEAPLFALRTLASSVHPQTDSHALVDILQCLPNLPDHPRLRHSAIIVIGEYAHWIASHPPFIVPSLQFVSSICQTDNSNETIRKSEMLGVISITLENLFRTCASHLTDHVMWMREFFILAYDQLKERDRGALCAAMGHAASSVNPEQSLILLNGSFEFLINKIGDLSNGNLLADVMDSICTLLISTPLLDDNTPLPQVQLIINKFNLFQEIVGKMCHQVVVMERFSHLFKYFFRRFPKSAKELVPHMANLISMGYQMSSSPALLYLGTQLIRGYVETDNMVKQMAGILIKSGLVIAARTENLSSEKDMDEVEDYFHLLATCLDYFPEIFALFSADCSLSLLLQRALPVLGCRSVGAMLKGLAFIRRGIRIGKEGLNTVSQESSMFLDQFGQHLTTSIIRSAVEVASSENIQDLADTLCEVVIAKPDLSLVAREAVLTFGGKLSSGQREALSIKLMSALNQSPIDYSRVYRLLDELGFDRLAHEKTVSSN